MTFEVMGVETGLLRMRDLRSAPCVQRPGARVSVLVLGLCGEPPFVGEVVLASKRSGRGDHVALLCLTCTKACAVLHLRGGKLACAGCSRHRTRRQSERTLVSWRCGGREEDRLLRIVRRGGSLEVMRLLVDEIVGGDIDRARVLAERCRDAAITAEVCS